ncbi:MAG TPA: hypothetical protein VFA70_12100, partial [Dehalococcoidia bacterium]|nr:hypothetical protein [Dehalococcoidia bacterium]
MVAVLEVTAEERPVLMFLLERLIPRLRMGAKEDIETADHLAYILRGLEQAPPGPGEIELVTQDVFALGIHLFSVSVDLEEYWLDLKQIADGREPAEEHSPEVTVPAAKYFPEMVANPKGWSFLGVEGQFTDLGFKLDRLITEESPRARALYNKARNPITAAASVRRRQNAERRLPHSTLASLHPDLV